MIATTTETVICEHCGRTVALLPGLGDLLDQGFPIPTACSHCWRLIDVIQIDGHPVGFDGGSLIEDKSKAVAP